MKLFASAFVLAGVLANATVHAHSITNSSDWNVAVLDSILASVPGGEKLAKVGDMEILVSSLQAWRDRLAGTPSRNFVFDGVAPAWTGGNLYYTFDGSVTPAHQKVFLDGAAEWAMFANLHFIPRTAEANYFTVRENASLEGGQSAVGMVGGQQFLDIGPDAWNRGTICHELGHTLGLVHEHQRSDRDGFVIILTNNIIPGAEGNFVKLADSLNTGAYDFYSVMHYRRDAISIDPNNLDTIEPLAAYAQFINVMGQQYDPVLSPLDRAGMAAKYGAGPALSSVVTNTLDSGPGSLRAALYFATDHPGTTITFNIPTNDPGFSGGVFTIRPTDRLPGLVNSTTLDGSSVPVNYNPNGPAIELNGVLCAPPSVYADGLHFKGTNCIAQSLVINEFPGAGVLMDGVDTSGNITRGCYLGTDASGNLAATNWYYPIQISGGANRNLIGGTNAAARNVISGSAYQGLVIRDSGTSSNLVEGNFIGLNAAGSDMLPNGWAGVNIFGGAQANVIGGAATGAGNVISGNMLQGIAISDTNTSGNLVQGNLIGLNATGSAAVPNGWSGVAIFGGSLSNIIGGTATGARNVISGNLLQGVTISDAGTAGNVVAGSYIGLNPAGTAALANGWAGVELFGGAQSNIIGGTSVAARNVISGNALQGIAIADTNTSGNFIQGNFIGPSPTGASPIPNGWSGIEIFGGASSNLIGSAAGGARNVISGNARYGVYIGDSGSSGNVLAGNSIGVGVSGSQPLANGWSGVGIYGGATANVIGGVATGAGNVISANANYGLVIAAAGTTGNLAQGNNIGLDAFGTHALPNGWDGISLYGGASGNVVGLAVDGSGAANNIAFNTYNGIVSFDPATTNNTFRGNNISSNGYLGINLVGGTENFYGVTANHTGAAAGPNNLQNYPIITNAFAAGAATTISGVITSTPNRFFLIDVYRSAAPDPSGYGEGQIYAGSISASTTGAGSGTFSITTSGNFSGQVFTATATDQTTGDTSEFSLAFLATNAPAAPSFLAPFTMTGTGFVARLSLSIGQSYRVQAATNLGANPVSWTDLTNFTAGVTNFVFLDQSATNLPRRFYRITSP